ncbi:hypothetical protein Lfu02_55950 [Longispora fulva]|uniref:DUF916 domain-containing protein n=1 Tax=Longispora fulva TaxID=619741 RepID=A0A8J7GIM9_9ACTN|nr:DUF916 domain-containing protein [Longispora fulva]MBG6137422.1 hypothetical protein [Longispora fulva]GIG61223.1 hypothetical protein Lfu02_55950 [Longispora fulva]
MRRFLILCVLALLAVLVPAPAHAADEVRWAVQPSSEQGPNGRGAFEYKAAPGHQILDYVGISNLSSRELTLSVYPTDAFTANDGAYSLLTAVQKPKDLGTWTDLAPKQYTIGVGKRLDIAFRLTIPATVTPGDHAGGIVASLSEEQTGADGKKINVDKRVAARVYVRVEGPVRPFAEVSSVKVEYDNPWNPFAGGDMTVTYWIRNSGNVRVAGAANVRARAPLGIGLGETGDVPIPEMLPGSEIAVTRKIAGVAPLGQLTALVTFNPVSAEGRIAGATGSGSVWAPPWLPLGLVALAVFVVVVLRVVRRRRRDLVARAAALA